MYDELVKALRGCVMSKPCDGCPYYDPNGPTEKCATMNIAAADAIEELIAERDVYRTEMTREHNRAVRLLWEKEHGMPLPEPPKEET